MKRAVQFVLMLALTTLLVWWLLRDVALSDIASTLAAVGPYWLGASFLLYGLSMTLRAAYFSHLFHGRVRLPSLLRIVYMHNLANNLLPTVIGELSFVYFAQRTRAVSTGEATAALIVTRLFDLLTVFGLTAAALLLTPVVPPQFSTFISVFGIVLTLVFIVLVLLVLRRAQALRALQWFFGIVGLGTTAFAHQVVKKAHETVDALQKTHGARNYAIGIGASLLVWLIAYMQTYTLLLTMGYGVTFLTAVLGTSLYRMASSLPISGIAGFGTVEFTWTVAFVLLGLTTNAAIVTGFAVHVILLLFAVLLGALGVLIEGAAQS